VTQRGEADVKAAIRAQGSRGSLKPTQALPIRRQRRGLRQCSGMSPTAPGVPKHLAHRSRRLHLDERPL